MCARLDRVEIAVLLSDFHQFLFRLWFIMNHGAFVYQCASR